MRPTPRDQGMRWLEQAQADLKWVRHLAEEGAHYLVCFLAQQAAEKGLKAILYALGEEQVVGHSVRRLSQRVAEAGAVAAGDAAQVDRWGVLDSYYIPTRYPNGLPEDIPARVYNREAAASALGLAEEVVGQVERWFGGTAPAEGDAAQDQREQR
ncbi:MAG: HEPN domain-containing protein [Candidatus Latescibacterota bacterium]